MINDYIYDIYIVPSWCMTIVPHSVSNYEFELQPNEWRIVFLFRNVWDKNIQYLQNNRNNRNNIGDKLSQKRKNKNIVLVDHIKKKKRKFA